LNEPFLCYDCLISSSVIIAYSAANGDGVFSHCSESL
jgi:hypothetical protein